MSDAANSTEDTEFGAGEPPGSVDGTRVGDGLSEETSTSTSISTMMMRESDVPAKGTVGGGVDRKPAYASVGAATSWGAHREPPPVTRLFVSETKWLEEGDETMDGFDVERVQRRLDAEASGKVLHPPSASSETTWSLTEETKNLFRTCLHSPVLPMTQSSLVNTLVSNPKLAGKLVGADNADSDDCEDLAVTFQKLVTRNPPVAAAFLFATSSSSMGSRIVRLPKLLDVLLNSVQHHGQSAMEVVVHVFELINAELSDDETAALPGSQKVDKNKNENSTQTKTATNRSVFPKPFLSRFISLCVFPGPPVPAPGGIEPMTTGTFPTKHENTKTTCAFLVTLLRNEFVAAKDFPYEVTGFCVENVSGKHAADLFAVLKQSELLETGGGS